MRSPLLAPPDRDGRLTRPGGRPLGWTEWGDERGAPVLFCTGAGMGASLGFGADAVRALGLRLLCVDRAGLGRSAPDPDKSFDTWTADVRAVLEATGVTRPPVVGFSQGAPFALALAAADLATDVALVAGQDDFAHPDVRRRLHPEVARLVAEIERDRAGFEAAFAPLVDAGGMWSLVVGSSAPADRALYEAPDFAAAFRRALDEGFAQGPAGYVRDLTLAMGRWPFRPEAIRARVRLWYGLLDTSPSHSPDFGATLAGRFPDAARHALADEGGSLLWTRAGDILRDLTRAPA